MRVLLIAFVTSFIATVAFGQVPGGPDPTTAWPRCCIVENSEVDVNWCNESPTIEICYQACDNFCDLTTAENNKCKEACDHEH